MGAGWRRAGSQVFAVRLLGLSASPLLCRDIPVMVGNKGPRGEGRRCLSLG